jgi:16S rRNA (adenine1518-N6/adenine1519-N6)-dimethyltransferase
MQDPLKAQSLLKSYGIRPKKKLGQNFLVSQAALDQILKAADLGDKEQILEIGAGLGALTRELARRDHKIIAIEYDQRFIPILHDLLKPYANVRVIQGDILQLELKDIVAPPDYIVVANIPYQITSALIRKLVEAPYPANRVILTIQKEVAERIIAQPGDLSLLALSVQIFGKPLLRSQIPPSAFFPSPAVDSCILRIDMHPEPKVPVGDIDLFFRIAKAGFSQKRKKLRNAIAAGLQISTSDVEEIMLAAKVSPSQRAQELTLDEWKRICEVYVGALRSKGKRD